jgi:hypothetical protein
MHTLLVQTTRINFLRAAQSQKIDEYFAGKGDERLSNIFSGPKIVTPNSMNNEISVKDSMSIQFQNI